MNEIQRYETIKAAKSLLDDDFFSVENFECLKSRVICDRPMNFNATLGDINKAAELYKYGALTRAEKDRIILDYLTGNAIVSVDQIEVFKDLLDKELIQKEEYEYLKINLFLGKSIKIHTTSFELIKKAYSTGCIDLDEYNSMRISLIYGEIVPGLNKLEKLLDYRKFISNGLISEEDFSVIKTQLLSGDIVCSPEAVESLDVYRKLLQDNSIDQSEYDRKKQEILPAAASSTNKYRIHDKIENLSPITDGRYELYDQAMKDIELKTSTAYQNAICNLEVLGDYKDSKVIADNIREELPRIKELEARKNIESAKKRKKRITLLSAVAVVVVLVSCGALYYWNHVVIPNQKKETAMELLDSGEYEKAYSLLNEIGDTETIKSNIYERAVNAINNEDYVLAYELLDGLDYNDSDELQNSIKNKYVMASLKTAEPGSTVYFGTYYQEYLTVATPIEWVVLKRSGNKVLLTSKYILDQRSLIDDKPKKEELTWLDCDLNTWLNKDFLKEAFTPEEIKIIASDVDPEYDRVFLLSKKEAQQYLEKKVLTETEGTEYAERLDPAFLVREWWTRDVNGIDSLEEATGVYADYYLSFYEDSAFEKNGIRPSIWIKIDE